MSDDIFDQFFGGFTGNDKNKEYRCVECKYLLERIVVQTAMREYKKLFYCKRNTCSRFGDITVIAKVITKK